MIRKTCAVIMTGWFLAAALWGAESDPLKLDPEKASKFAAMAMSCIEKGRWQAGAGAERVKKVLCVSWKFS